ncbi:hypothetical protein F443_14521 [Phytophthora nicotianae P1569]|uniref:Uncharacterized protein n=4 Tax=Phytophthora nicotianae TaxID=4792 RepID=V9EL42_PHYNI|nr:hypothetical protein F443_14521 [Phytophthora nicotianae P1569]ETO68675.1 hypothetical protein F444_14534 [Phytophthora nicotianae P1976]
MRRRRLQQPSYKYSRCLDLHETMGSEIENLLQELRDAYATIDSLQRQLHSRDLFGTDEEESDNSDDEPWFDTFDPSDDESVIDLTYDTE